MFQLKRETLNEILGRCETGKRLHTLSTDSLVRQCGVITTCGGSRRQASGEACSTRSAGPAIPMTSCCSTRETAVNDTHPGAVALHELQLMMRERYQACPEDLDLAPENGKDQEEEKASNRRYP